MLLSAIVHGQFSFEEKCSERRRHNQRRLCRDVQRPGKGWKRPNGSQYDRRSDCERPSSCFESLLKCYLDTFLLNFNCEAFGMGRSGGGGQHPRGRHPVKRRGFLCPLFGYMSMPPLLRSGSACLDAISYPGHGMFLDKRVEMAHVDK